MQKTCCGGLEQWRILYRLNVAAFILHLATFIAALVVSIIFASQSFQTEVTSDFRGYAVAPVGPPAAGPFASMLRSLGFYQLIWINLPFPLITALFHALIAFDLRNQYNQWVFAEGRNPLRWIEYSITASLMTWTILQLSGVTNIFLLVIVGIVGNVVLQLQGYLMEVLNQRPPIKNNTTAVTTNWIPMLSGWLLFLGQWSVIFAYFFSALASPRPPTAEQVPWFVYSIVIGLFIQFALFGLVQWFHYADFAKKWFNGFFSSGYGYEVCYIVLSLTSKVFLTVNLLVGIATNPMSS
jgi:Heliorhodopsin